MECYVDDLLGGKLWCDSPNCRPLVEILQASLRARKSGDRGDAGRSGNRYPLGPSHDHMRRAVNAVIRARCDGMSGVTAPFDAVLALAQLSAIHMAEALQCCAHHLNTRAFSRLLQQPAGVCSGLADDLDGGVLLRLVAGPSARDGVTRAFTSTERCAPELLMSVVLGQTVQAMVSGSSPLQPATLAKACARRSVSLCAPVDCACDRLSRVLVLRSCLTRPRACTCSSLRCVRRC
jgi:hypothetical protein